MENVSIKQETLEFREVTVDMRREVERYTKSAGLFSSEFTFTSYMVWGARGKITIAFEDGVMYSRCSFPGVPMYMMAPVCLDPADYGRAIVRAEQYMVNNGVKPLFVGIAEQYAEQFRMAGFELEEDRDNFDYVYDMEDLRDLPGKKYHAKRNFINRLEQSESFEFVTLGPENIEECIDLYEQWASNKDEDDSLSIEWELDAIRTALSNMMELDLLCGGIRINGEIKAFSVADKPWKDMAVTYFEKAEAEVPGLYPLINQQMAANLLNDVKYINREEDMGLEGLRKAKLSYHPSKFIKKYRAAKRQNEI